MSKLPFVCLNVEPESEDDEEIDNTAEIKLEDALKLYQHALKFHAQGPAAFSEAQAAYDELFDNEIFTYGEALSFRKRQEALEEESTDSEDGSDSDSDNDLDQQDLNALLPASVEGGPSTLRQVVYLSYKNFGLFQLARLQHELVEREVAGEPLERLEPGLQKRVLTRVRKSLELFTDALDKDDTDVELWRQISRLTGLLGSQRMSRFCLETVLATKEDGTSAVPDDLVMSVVREELREVYDRVHDGAAISTHFQQTPISSRIRDALDPCPYFPKPTAVSPSTPLTERGTKTLRLKVQSWAALGKQIIRQLRSSAPSRDDFTTMGSCFRIETALEPTARTEEAKSRRRRTIDGTDSQRSTFLPEQEEDVHMDGIEEPTSPIKSPASPELSKTSLSSQQRCSNDNVPAVATLSTPATGPQASKETEPSERVSESPILEKANPMKRSSEDAGLPQDPPEARSRSKRLRARETGGDEDASKDQRQQFEKQLKPLQDADRHLFNVADTLLKRLSVTALSGTSLAHDLSSETELGSDIAEVNDLLAAANDLRSHLKGWNSNKSSLILHGTGAGATATLISKGNEAGLANFLEHAKSGQQVTHDPRPLLLDQHLDEFINTVNRSWFSADELALSWLAGLLGSQLDDEGGDDNATVSKYLSLQWSDELKNIVHEMLSLVDDYAFKRLDNAIVTWTQSGGQDESDKSPSLELFVAMIQAMFEIQLDMYNSMIKPTSKADQPTRTLQKARLQRWAFLSNQAVARRSAIAKDNIGTDVIALRHLYSMTLYLSLDEDSRREHIINCLQEVKDSISEGEDTKVILPNIDIMPEISADAIDQEISRLTTTDFFLSVFNPSDDDPVATIESLEPIIMPVAGSPITASTPRASSADPDRGALNAASPSRQLVDSRPPEVVDSQRIQLLDFLSKSTASLQLSLWNRLSNAYSAIASPPFVFLCTIHSIKVVLSELGGSTYSTQMESTRTSNLLIWIRNLIDLIDKCCSLAINETTCLDCMDEDNLKLALSSVSSCIRLFHVYALWDDHVRLGQSSPPTQQAGAANAYKQAMNMLREVHVKIWRLLYVLLREAAVQDPELFPDSNDEFMVYLAAVHSAVGLREYCKLGKKSFLKFVKSELLSLQPSDLHEWRYQMAQVTYDLYDLRVLADSGTWMTLQEHNCPADPLDRPTAREILPMVMAQIQGISVRDLIKPDRRDFKQTIDKIQDLIGPPRQSSVQQSFNRRQLLGLQKRAIRGSDLIEAFKGTGGLTNMPVRNEYTSIANTGWYFVIGYLRLASFRSAKRTGPDTTKELDEAMTYLKFDIDFDCEKWETWYRLAQAYDAMLDEEVTWSAERINNKMEDLVTLQRQAIHCYHTAVSLAVRQGESYSDNCKGQSQDVAMTMSELYSDFGKRLYASSRPPFDMQAFSVRDHARWYFTHAQVKFKDKPFQAMSKSSVWLVASVAFRQAIGFRPTEWHNWYMLGKCLWKLSKEDDVGGVTHAQVLNAFAKACELAPNKDSRHPEKGPILEPHFKLLSTVHKLVYPKELLEPEEGAIWLRRSSYSQKVELKSPKGRAEWFVFARHVIRNLRAADKANWHHRIMARAAQMAFEDSDQSVPAEAAILQLTPHIFTKTMVIQVWRTLFERAGRHFVYTTRYVKFFIKLLTIAGDRTSLEALGKKIRKKHAEFIDHVGIWTRICKEHVNLLRSQMEVPNLHEEQVLFVLPYETFVPNAALLQTWAQPAGAEPPVHPLLSVLREAIDLKKLNLNLIANQGIDDLIGDTYAKLYEEMVPGLVSDATNEKNREAMRVDRILMGDPGVDIDPGAENAVPLTNPSGRAKIVGRMEVRKRAEALVQRVSAAQGPIKGKAAALAEEAAAQEEADESESGPAAASPHASHDADDESELSDLDDEQLGDADNGEGFEEDDTGDVEDADIANEGVEEDPEESMPRGESAELEQLQANVGRVSPALDGQDVSETSEGAGKGATAAGGESAEAKMDKERL